MLVRTDGWTDLPDGVDLIFEKKTGFSRTPISRQIRAASVREKKKCRSGRNHSHERRWRAAKLPGCQSPDVHAEKFQNPKNIEFWLSQSPSIGWMGTGSMGPIGMG